MKTIAQQVNDGIKTVTDLQDALQTAMQLEFSTIPPYLCAQWSIGADPSGVGDMIESVVVQEMYHFALAGNMLTAIGGVPDIANASFIPNYPTDVLPGGIRQSMAVDLKPLSKFQLQVFMQIENPQFAPVAYADSAPPPATIGDFYDAISAAFVAINPPIDTDAHFVTMGDAAPISGIGDAVAAISRIKHEGEGFQDSPDQVMGGPGLAHYYVFKEIYSGRTLVQTSGKWDFSGEPVQFPSVFPFDRSNAIPDPCIEFNKALTQLLLALQLCWKASGTAPNLGAMKNLQSIGTNLIKAGIRPAFLWAV